jgi:hypothetical protein
MMTLRHLMTGLAFFAAVAGCSAAPTGSPSEDTASATSALLSGCTLSTTCSSKYTFHPPPTHYAVVPTLDLWCPDPSQLDGVGAQRIYESPLGGTTVLGTFPGFQPSDYYNFYPPGVFDLSSLPTGATFDAKVTDSSGSIMLWGPLTVPDCCRPLTACTDLCSGTIPDGCGGTVKCGCEAGDSCVSGKCVSPSTCKITHCPKGLALDPVNCECDSPG